MPEDSGQSTEELLCVCGRAGHRTWIDGRTCGLEVMKQPHLAQPLWNFLDDMSNRLAHAEENLKDVRGRHMQSARKSSDGIADLQVRMAELEALVEGTKASKKSNSRSRAAKGGSS